MRPWLNKQDVVSRPCNPNTWQVTHPHWIWVGRCSEQNAAEITFLLSYKIRVVLLWQKVIGSGLRLGSLVLSALRWPAGEGWLAGEPELKAPLSVVHGGHTFPECLGFGVKDCVSFMHLLTLRSHLPFVGDKAVLNVWVLGFSLPLYHSWTSRMLLLLPLALGPAMTRSLPEFFQLCLKAPLCLWRILDLSSLPTSILTLDSSLIYRIRSNCNKGSLNAWQIQGNLAKGWLFYIWNHIKGSTCQTSDS